MSSARTISTSLLAILLLVAGLALPASAADRAAEAKVWLETTVDEFLKLFRDPKLTQQERLDRVESMALERFDFDSMTKLVLGKNRKKLSPAQQGEFRDEFKEHISLTYGHNLESYSDERVEFGEARLEKNGDVTIKTTIVGGAVDGVVVVYRLRTKGSEPWRVIDVILEGVSTIQNFRSQVQDIVSNRGVEQLIQVLREKNQARANGAAPAGGQ